MLTRPTFSADAHSSAMSFSISLRGSTKAELEACCAASGTGSARLSILPLGVSGMRAKTT